jgi:competence protein ComEA
LISARSRRFRTSNFEAATPTLFLTANPCRSLHSHSFKEELMQSPILQALLLGAIIGAPFAAVAGPVNVNSADAAQIARELKGVGLARAQAIVTYRDKNGPFKTADDLRKVKGFGAKMLERNRANIRFNNSGKSSHGGETQAGAEQ